MGMHILLYLLHVPSKHLVLIKFLLENELILEVFFIKHVSQILDLIASSLYCGEQKKNSIPFKQKLLNILFLWILVLHFILRKNVLKLNWIRPLLFLREVVTDRLRCLHKILMCHFYYKFITGVFFKVLNNLLLVYFLWTNLKTRCMSTQTCSLNILVCKFDFKLTFIKAHFLIYYLNIRALSHRLT